MKDDTPIVDTLTNYANAIKQAAPAEVVADGALHISEDAYAELLEEIGKPSDWKGLIRIEGVNVTPDTNVPTDHCYFAHAPVDPSEVWEV